MRRTRAGLGLLLAVALLPGPAPASERSELLVAQGEVAYNAGRLDEARRRFEDALAADPGDAAARGWLDVLAAATPGELRGARPERTAKRWDVEAGTGVQYDSNVRLDPNHAKDDAAFLFTLAGHVDPWRDDRTLVRLDYDFFQSLHTDVTDFDFRAHRLRGTVSRALTPGLWLGVQGGYGHASLGSDAYLQEPWVMPYASVLEGDRGATQLMYRHGEEDYMGSPFDTPTLDRDGPLDAVGLNQIVFLFDRRLVLNVGYAYETESPRKASGDDFARHSQIGTVGVRFPSWWRTLVELDYLFRYDDYTEPNSAVDFRKTRLDKGSYVTLYVRRPIVPHLDAVLSYFATVNPSNIALYDYDRNVVALELKASF